MTVAACPPRRKAEHDSHCWLPKGGQRWSIRRVTRDGFVFLRRPNPLGLPHYTTLDAHRINWEAYCNRASELLAS